MMFSPAIQNYFQKGFSFSLIVYAVALSLSMSISNLALAFMSLCVLFLSFQDQPISLFKNISAKPIISLMLFFFWASGVTLFIQKQIQLDSLSSISKIWNFFPYWIIPLGFPFLKSQNRVQFLNLALVSTCVVILLGALQYAFHFQYFFEGHFVHRTLVNERRLNGFQSHPLHAAALYTVLFLASVSMFLQSITFSQIKRKLFYFMTSSILLMGIFLTVSRSYMLSAAVGFLIILALKNWKTLFIGVFVFILFLFIVTRTVPYISERLYTLRPSQTDEAGRQRIWVWRAALEMISDHPFTGVGYKQWKNNLSPYIQRFPDWIFVDPAIYGHAHNTYLTVAAETGIPGLILFLIFWIFLLKDQIQNLRYARSKLNLAEDSVCSKRIENSDSFYELTQTFSISSIACLIALMFAGLFEHNLFTATVCLSLTFILGLAQIKVNPYSVRS